MENLPFCISVIIPVYNAEKFVTKAVESALQFPEVKEILLIEDGSPDNALEICRQLADNHTRVKLFQHPDKGNHGAGASRNLGLQNATCPYIAFLDADDFYLPNRFDADSKVFAENPQADGVYNAIGAFFYSLEAKMKFNDVFTSEITTVTKTVEPHQLFPSFIQMEKDIGYFSLDGLTLNIDVLSKMDYWFNPDLRLHQDTEYIFRLAYYAQLFPGEIKFPVAKRGVHDENRFINAQHRKWQISQSREKMWNSMYQWALKNNLPEIYTRHLYCTKVSKSVIAHSFFSSCAILLTGLIHNRGIFTNPVIYNPIHYHLFGTNRVSVFLLKCKNKLQQIL